MVKLPTVRLFPLDIYFYNDTFIKKGIKIEDSVFGVYCFTGFQGSGKTMNAVDFAVRNAGAFRKIYTNINSLSLPHKYISCSADLNPDWRDCLVIIDEVHKAYPKNSKPDKKFYSFLQESRKHHRVCILITQEWLEVPMWLRRPVKLYVFNKRLIKNFYIENVFDARTMHWDEHENDYVCDLVQRNVKKWNLELAEKYDTNETIYWDTL